MPSDITALRNRLVTLNTYGQMSAEDHAALTAAINDHEKIEAVRVQVAAFDWQTLISLLTPFLSWIPGFGPILALLPEIGTIINAILALLNINPIPIPSPIPIPPGPQPIPPVPVPGGGGTIPPVPLTVSEEAESVETEAPEPEKNPPEKKGKK